MISRFSYRIAPVFSRAVGAKSGAFETSLLVCMVAMLYWLVSHTYEGIYHDAIIYALLVAKHLDPESFRSDLFFLFGSQDAFSLFTPVYGQLVRWLGFDLAARSIVLSGAGLWITGLFVLGRTAFPSLHPAHFLVIFLAAASYSYSPNAITFRLNENFATARVIAMPAALLSMACWLLRTRLGDVAALLLGAFATAMHPLLGVWTFVVYALDRLSDRLVVASTLLGVVFLFGASSFDGLTIFRPMDAQWADLVEASSTDVFVGLYGIVNLDRPVTVILLLWLGGRLGSQQLRRTYLLVAMLTGWMFFVSQVCSNWYPIEIVMKVQPWRVTWLGLVFSVMAGVDLVWRGMQSGKCATKWVVVSMLVLFAYWDLSVCLLVVALGLSIHPSGNRFWCRICDEGTELSKKVQSIFPFVAIPIVLVLLPAMWVGWELLGAGVSSPWWSGMDGLRGLVLAGGGGISIVLLLYLARWKILCRGLIVMSAVGLVLAAIAWDTRLPAAKSFEKTFFSTNQLRDELSGLMPSGSTVAWPGMQQSVWFALGRANYMAPEQAIGIVFSREKGFESKRRAERVAASTMLATSPDTDTPVAALHAYRKALARNGFSANNIHKYFGGSPSKDGIPYLCEDRALDWVVSPIADAQVAGRGWVKAFQPSGMKVHYLYACHA